MENKKSSVMDQFTLKIAPNKMTALLVIRPPESDNDITVERVSGFLKESGVVFGYNENSVADAIEGKKWGEEIRAAEGRPQVPGANGSVVFKFDTSPKGRPTVREDGRLDFFDLHTAQCVHAGDKLAEVVLPGDGINGMDVLGNEIPAQKGKPARIPRGKNTSFSDESKSVLVADMDGIVKLTQSGSIEVTQSMSISGDIDLTTGNIEVVGDLAIKGDVKAGFRVSATGNIEIGGTVEDAHVIAGGSVVVKGGFLGEGNGEIKAGGDVFIKYVYRQRITAGKDIEVIEEATQAHLSAEEVIRITRGKGILVGGEASAGKAVEVRIAGNEQNTPTEIYVGARTDLVKKIEAHQKNSVIYEEKLDTVADQMSKLMVKKKKTGLSPKDEEKFRLLDKLSADIDASIQITERELAECEKEFEGLKKNAYLDVFNRIYPGVVMKITKYVKHLEKERERTRFKISGTEIIGIEDYKEAAVAS